MTEPECLMQEGEEICTWLEQTTAETTATFEAKLDAFMGKVQEAPITAAMKESIRLHVSNLLDAQMAAIDAA